MKRNVVLGLDLDGVLYDYHWAMYTFSVCELGYAGSYTDYWIKEWPSFSNEKQEYLVSLPMPYEISEPSKQVVKFLKLAEKYANDVNYITSRHDDLQRVTERYLRKHNFPFQDNLIITREKDVQATLCGVTHFLDDMGKHVEKVSKVCSAFLLARVHNIHEREKYNTVNSLGEFAYEVFIK